MNTSSPIFDEWDFQVIRYMKQDESPNITGIRKIWAERCGCEIPRVDTKFIFYHFFEILEKLPEKPNYIRREIFDNAAPGNFWKIAHYFDTIPEEEKQVMRDKFNCFDLAVNMDSVRYWETMLISVLVVYRFMDCKYLPGFREYMEEIKKNAF